MKKKSTLKAPERPKGKKFYEYEETEIPKYKPPLLDDDEIEMHTIELWTSLGYTDLFSHTGKQTVTIIRNKIREIILNMELKIRKKC